MNSIECHLAPRTLERFMDAVLRDTNDTAAVYLDDVLLHAITIDEAIENLRKVLRIFWEQCLTLNLKKCRFLVVCNILTIRLVSNSKQRQRKNEPTERCYA